MSTKESGDRQAKGPRFLVIGAGSRGNTYASAITQSTNGVIVAIAEPIEFKRRELGTRYIWKNSEPEDGEEFEGWKEFLEYEQTRRKDALAGKNVPEGVDGALICTLDEQHAEIVIGLAPLNLHILCEKPLATNLRDCLKIYNAIRPTSEGATAQSIFSICHVLRYSPYNILLRKLILEGDVIGDIISVEHTEPVGWWHFSHSYVRGNWRKESVTAPSLLTKSCHDIDFLLWLLCSPPPGSKQPPHMPLDIMSTGSLKYFKKSRKPAAAKDATNCLSCPIKEECIYSASKIYVDKFLKKGDTRWPVKIVAPEIEACLTTKGPKAAEDLLLTKLEEDYTPNTPQELVDARPWFGRCVYEAGNDVCDDQVVIVSWEDDPVRSKQSEERGLKGRGAKTATFHMVANTESVGERKSKIYGTRGEITADSLTIRVHNFGSGKTKTYFPESKGGGHGGGDTGLACQFVKAVDAVKKGTMNVEKAQALHLGCSAEEILRSHAMVFAAEEARHGKKVVAWTDWWQANVQGPLEKMVSDSKG